MRLAVSAAVASGVGRAAILLGLLVAIDRPDAQSNQILDRVLATEQLSVGRAAWLVLAGADHITVDASVSDALTYVERRGWRLRSLQPAAPVRLGDYALLIMHALDWRGGLMFRLLPVPRYAARELAFRDVLSGDMTPYRFVSGAEALQILGRVLELAEVLP